MSVARRRIVLGCVIAGSLAVRLSTISERSFWLDEAISYSLACESSWVEMFQRIAGDFHPPLSYVLIRLWSNLVGTSVIWFRMFSVFWALMTLIGCYLFCRDALDDPRSFRTKRDGHWIAISSVALVGSCSQHIMWSQETRMYTMGTALAFFSAWMLTRAMRENDGHSWLWWSGYSTCAIAFVYTHYFALFTIAGQVLWCIGSCVADICRTMKQRKTTDCESASKPVCEELSRVAHGPISSEGDLGMLARNTIEFVHQTKAAEEIAFLHYRTSATEGGVSQFVGDGEEHVKSDCGAQLMSSRVLAATIAFGAIAVAFLPWASILFTQTKSAEEEYWTPKTDVWTILECFGQLTVPTNSYATDHFTAFIVTGALVIIVLSLMWGRTSASFFLVSMIAVPFVFALLVSVTSVPVFVARYFLFSYVFVLCSVPFLVAKYLPFCYRSWIIGLLVFNSLVGHYDYWTSLDTSNRPGIHRAALHVAERRERGDLVIVTDLWSYFSARYYLRKSEAPLLFVREGKLPEPHYCGGSAVAREWMLGEDRLKNYKTERIWILGASSILPLSTFCDEWQPVSESAGTFPEVYYFLRTVTVTAYDRRKRPESNKEL